MLGERASLRTRYVLECEDLETSKMVELVIQPFLCGVN